MDILGVPLTAALLAALAGGAARERWGDTAGGVLALVTFLAVLGAVQALSSP